MSRALLLDILRTIRHTFSRFISLVVIVALGTGFFVGIKSAGPSMEETAKEYFESNNLMDIRVQSTIGLTETDLNAIKNVEGVKGAMGQKFVDALVLVNGQPEIDIDGSQISTRAYGIDLNQLQKYYYGEDDENFINRPTLLEGSYPTASNQCLVDASTLSTPESYKIGSTITLEADSNTDLSVLSVTEFQIVGIIESPYYLSFERGNSLVGSGKIGTYIFIPDSAFTNDYYSEIYVTLDNAQEAEPYSQEYFDYVSKAADTINEMSAPYVEARAESLKNTLPQEIADAEKEYNSAKESVEKQLKEGEETIALYQKYVDDPEGSYNEAVQQAAEALGIAEEEFNGNSSAYYSAVETYNALLEEYKASRTEYQQKYTAWSEAKSKTDSAQTLVATAQSTVNTTTQLVSTTQNIVNSTSEVLTALEAYQNGQMDDNQIAGILNTLQSINPDLYNAISSLSAVSMATQAITLVTPYLDQQKSQLAQYESQLKESQAKLNEYKTQLQQADALLTAAKAALDASNAQMDSAYGQLNAYYDQLEGQKTTLSQAQIELMLGENSVNSDLNLLKATIANAETYLKKAQDEYTTLKAAAESQLLKAENAIDSGKSLLKKLDTAKWNVYDRNDTPGYSSYESAISNLSVLSNIFPLIFFLVAALVCLTTMTRMVEEERTQLGTLKALGYSSGTISAKYLLYALFASIIGAALGIVIGVYAFPFAIFKAYSIMFTTPSLIFTMPVQYIIIGMAVSVVTTLAASAIACIRELRVHPASLMRPKAPKPGKRVLLERIGFIWKRISFTGKVTTRNLFRNKTRFVMTVIGIGGCTALILASIGLYSSVNNLMKKQYDADGIAQYDVQFVFADNQKDDSQLMQILTSDSRISSIMLSSMQSVTGGSDRTDKTSDVYLFVPENADALSSYIKLQNRQTGAALALDDTGAIITEKFAEDTDTGIGDKIWIETSDGEKIEIPVAGIAENYTFSYIYISENLYQYLFQDAVGYNYAIATLDDGVLSDSQASDGGETKKANFAAEYMAYDGINAVAYVSDTVDTLNEVIGVLSIIVFIFIVAAGLLAFVVLYNLSNINISERQRELATIKVLGFHDKEVSAYVYRENVVLTVIGIIFGLVLGIFIHKLLITYCAVDTVMYVQSLTWYSFVIAGALTAVFAVIVNMIMHKKMKKIDMVTSLKAVE